ncbi:MAG: AI-2E family transporter [Gemmatimonadota bacterium]|nr:AI-2E family transporter [Gemmatimonadota bacterium]
MTEPSRREPAPGPPGAVTPPIQVDESPGRHGRAVPPGSAPPPVHTERRRRTVGWRTADIMRAAAAVIGMYVVLQLIWYANALLLTTFLAVLFGLAVAAGVDRLERFRIPRGLGAAMIVLSFFGLLVLLGLWMAPTLREQGAELRRRLPEAVDRVQEWVNRRQGFMSLFLPSPQGGAPTAGATSAAAAPRAPQAPAEAPAAAPPPTPAAGTQTDTARASPSSPSATETLSRRLGGQLGGVVRYLFPFLQSTLAAIAGLLLIIFLAIYIAADPDLYHRGLMHLFPRPARKRAGEILSAMATVLRKWLVTQLIAMAAIGTVTTVVLLVLDVKAALALGVIAGLLEFVPTIGPTLSAIPAVAMGFLDSPQKALYVVIAYVGIQFLENHILIPMLMKGGVDLPPALTILSQALGVLLFGFLGLMVAVPMLAAVMVAVKMLYVEDVVGDYVPILDHGEDNDDDDG